MRKPNHLGAIVAFLAMLVFALLGMQAAALAALAVFVLAIAIEAWRTRREGRPMTRHETEAFRRASARGPRDPRVDPSVGEKAASPFLVAGPGEPRYRCPVCGFQGLAKPPLPVDWTDEMCPSCGFQFGVTHAERGFSYADWRRDWVDSGFPWRSETIPLPPDRDAHAQYLALVESGTSGETGTFAEVAGGEEDGPYTCPCCGLITLPARREWEICRACGWEDDGQDDHDADRVKGGPNGSLSLTEARARFRAREQR